MPYTLGAFSEGSSGLDLSLETDGLGWLVTVAGSLDLLPATELQARLAAIVDKAEPGQRLVIDLGGLIYISSTGVGALINTLVRARKRDLGLVFRRIPPKVASVLELLGVMEFFPMEEADG